MGERDDMGLSEGGRAVRNSTWKFAASTFEAVVAILVISLLARSLSLEEFGRYSFVVAFTAITRFLAGLGIPIIVTREIAKDPQATPTIYASALVLHIVLAAAYLVVMTGAVALTSTDTEIVISTALCAAAINADFFARLFGAVFKGFERMEYEAITTAACSASYLAATLYVVWTRPTLIAIFSALLFSALVDAGLGYYYLVRKFVRPRLRSHCGRWKDLLKEAYPVGLRRILRVISYRADTVLLVALRGTVEAGLFHAVYKIVNGFAYLAETVVQAVYPILSRQGASGDSHDTYRLTLKYLVILSLPLIIAFGFFAEPIIRLVLGPKFLPAAWVMSVLGGALALLFISTLMERMLIAHGRQTASSVLTAISVAILVVLDIVLIPVHGALGAAVATLAAEGALVAIYHVYIVRRVSPRGVWGEVVRPALAAGLSCLALWGLGTAHPVLSALLGILAYLAGLFVLGTFSRAELAVVQECLRRRPRQLAAGRPGG